MRNVILVFILLFCQFINANECQYFQDKKEIKFQTTDEFGCIYEDRELHSFDAHKISLIFQLINEGKEILQLKIKDQDNNDKYNIFDIFLYSAPEVDKIRDAIFLEKKNILFLLHGYTATVINEFDETEVDAAFYDISIYKIYNNTPIKISSDATAIDFSGIDGFYNGKYQRYPYKKHEILLEKINTVNFNDEYIIKSIENLLKQDHTDEESNIIGHLWSIETIDSIISDIPITQNNVESYNNIAYYFEKMELYDESIFILDKIVSLYPNRTVSYINLGDTYWKLGKKDEALKAYQKYIDFMTKNGKKNRIPARIIEHMTQAN
ncbi:tetratricopeptide repeat protein [Orbus sturtevantii]|uniref:tetratricopeptide repeat protein n=1 Tax=Orbus sturtevantii TaxID=3074109 RepID=UPI00370DAF92